MKMESPNKNTMFKKKNLIGSLLPPVMVMNINLALLVSDFSGKHNGVNYKIAEAGWQLERILYCIKHVTLKV